MQTGVLIAGIVGLLLLSGGIFLLSTNSDETSQNTTNGSLGTNPQFSDLDKKDSYKITYSISAIGEDAPQSITLYKKGNNIRQDVSTSKGLAQTYTLNGKTVICTPDSKGKITCVSFNTGGTTANPLALPPESVSQLKEAATLTGTQTLIGEQTECYEHSDGSFCITSYGAVLLTQGGGTTIRATTISFNLDDSFFVPPVQPQEIAIPA